MSCRTCNNFHGDPCPCCRTLLRLKFLITQGILPQEHEAKVLGVLRQAAGGVSDIYEEYERFVPPPGLETGAAGSAGAAPALGVVATPSAAAAEASAPAADHKAEEKKKKKEARRAKREEKKTRERGLNEPGVEETPEVKEGAAGSREARGDVIRAAKAEPLEEREIRAEGHKKVSQEDLDKFVSDHPDRFGLGSISVRGSAARQLRENDDVRRRRPAEPSGPPPERTGAGGRHRDQRRERSRSKKRKSKGAAHRQRGRDFWRRVHNSEPWPQRQRARQRPASGGRGR